MHTFEAYKLLSIEYLSQTVFPLTLNNETNRTQALFTVTSHHTTVQFQELSCRVRLHGRVGGDDGC